MIYIEKSNISTFKNRIHDFQKNISFSNSLTSAPGHRLTFPLKKISNKNTIRKIDYKWLNFEPGAC